MGCPSNRHSKNKLELRKRKATMKNIYVIFLTLFLDLIAFTIILPLFPSIIDYYSEQDKSTKDTSLHFIRQSMELMRMSLQMPDKIRYNNVLIGGILGSIFSFLQFLCSPVIGICSDVFGRKPVLLFSMCGTLLSYFLWFKAETFSVFLISRVIGGLMKGSVTLCTAMMTDITTKENRGKGMAFIGLGFSFGFITGPLIGAYFASKTHQPTGDLLTHAFALPAQIAMGVQIVAILLVLFVVDETVTQKNVFNLTSLFSKIWLFLNPLSLFTTSSGKTSSSTLHRLTIVNFLFIMIFSGLEFTLTFLTHERFNFTSMQQGKLFFVAGITMMTVQGGYVRRMKHSKEKKIALQGIAAMIPAMLMLAFSSSVTLTYAALLLYSFGAGTVVPCLTALYSQQSKDTESGENIGIFRSAGALARAIAPFITCSVYWSFGSSFCYSIGAVLFIIPLVFLSRTKHVETAKKSE